MSIKLNTIPIVVTINLQPYFRTGQLGYNSIKLVQMKQNIELGQVYTLKDSIDYSQGATVSKIVTKNKCGSTTLFSFDKGQNLSEHTTPFDAIAMIIDGTCEI